MCDVVIQMMIMCYLPDELDGDNNNEFICSDIEDLLIDGPNNNTIHCPEFGWCLYAATCSDSYKGHFFTSSI